MLELTASATEDYVRMAKGVRPATAEEIEELRQLARKCLVKMLYLPPEREHLSELDDNGLDRDIMALTAPLDAPDDSKPAA
jgi:hypothetical protein